MRLIAIIPARAGSKRLPGKNIKFINGHPLIHWTLKSAMESDIFQDIIVSTDSIEIAEIARSSGATKISMRPDVLSGDYASTVDVVLHTLDEYENQNGLVDGVMLLQPTSPFRPPELIKQAANIFDFGARKSSVVSFGIAKNHPAWCFKPDGVSLAPFLGWDCITMRSQDLEPAFFINGNIYISSPALIRKTKGFLNKETIPMIMEDPLYSIDIDTKEDFLYASYQFASKK